MVVADHLVLMEPAVIPGMGEVMLSGGVIRSIQGLTIMGQEATEAEAMHLHIRHALFIPKGSQLAHTSMVDQAAVVMVRQVEGNRHLAMVGMLEDHHHQGVGLQMAMVATRLAAVMAHMEMVGMAIMADLAPRHTLRAARHPVDEGGLGSDIVCLL